MTSSAAIITILVIAILLGVATRIMKDDRVFIFGMLTLLAGSMVGALMNKSDSKDSNEYNVNSTQVYNPTQVSPANCVDFHTALGNNLAPTANPASKVMEIPVRDSSVDVAPSEAFGEIRGQPTPFIPFDTS